MEKGQKNSKDRKPRHPFKTPSRFRLSFTNENTLNEIWTVKFTRAKVIIAVIVILLAISSMVATLILLTPIRTLLPGYLKESQRHQNIVNTIRIDSLLARAEINSAYINNLRTIFSESADTVMRQLPTPSDSAMSVDSLLPASDIEREFVRKFEEQEKFNLNVLSPIAADGVDFFTPVAGAMVADNGEANLTSVTLIAAPRSPVTAILEGTVVDANSTLDDGNTVIIQHPNGFVSRYGGINSLFVNKGDKVLTGTALGVIDDGSEKIILELWHNGTRLNPADYIPFF